jgi:hypothetical protein
MEGRPSPTREMAFISSIELAEQLMKKIDARWPSNKAPGKN